MELTEKERLILVEKKTEIRKLTEDIMELMENSNKNKVEIKKKVSGILSLLSIIASYTNSKKIDVVTFTQFAEQIFYLLDNGAFPKATAIDLEFFCNIANTIQFNFTGRGLKVNIQKIDLSLFRTGK